MVGRGLTPLLVGSIVVATSGCHAFDSLEDCSSDADCDRGSTCNDQGHFCELDGRPVAIGAVLAQTGELGAFGREMASALDVAASIFEEAGGILGRPLEYRVRDDESDPEAAAERARELIDEGVVGIVGPISSPQAAAVVAVTHLEGVLTVSPAAGAPSVGANQAAEDRSFFRTVSTMRTGSGAAMALFAFAPSGEERPCRAMDLLYSADETGSAYADAIEDLFEKQGGCIVSRIEFPGNTIVDYSSHVATLIRDRPDCAGLVAWPEAGAEIIRQFHEALLASPEDPAAWSDFYFLGTSALHGDRFLSEARVDPAAPIPSDAEGMYGADIDSTPDTREYREFRFEYNNRLGVEPTDTDTPPFVANTFDAAVLVALAVERAGSPDDRSAILASLRRLTTPGDDLEAFAPGNLSEALSALRRGEEIHYKGASSVLFLDDSGATSSPTVIWHVRAGRFEEVGEYSEADIKALLDAQPAQSACE